MYRLRQFTRRFRPVRERAGIRPSVRQLPDDRERITRQVIERLSEDETLRGALTDTGFGPIFTFVTSMIPAATGRALRTSVPESAEEDVSRAARMLTRAIVAAAEAGDVNTLPSSIDTPMFSEAEAIRVRETLSRGFTSNRSSDVTAERIIDALRTATQEQGS